MEHDWGFRNLHCVDLKTAGDKMGDPLFFFFFFFLHRRNCFIPLEKNTEIQVKTVTCLKLSDILILLHSTMVCLDTEHKSLSQAHPCPQQAGTL